MRQGEPGLSASAAATASMGTPHHSAAVAAASALATWCAPCNASRTSVCPHGDDRRNRARRSSSSVTSSARTSASAPTPYPSTGHALSDAMARTRGSSKFRTARPDAGRAATSSPLARATPSRSPRDCHVRHVNAGHDADVGTRDLAQPFDVAHTPDPHLEDHPPRILRRVEQRQGEAQLVVEGTLARGGAERRRQAAGQEVLGGGLAHRPRDADRAAHPIAGQRPEAQQRGGGVADTDGGPAQRLLRGEVGRRARLERCRDEGVAVARGHDRDVELPRPDRPASRCSRRRRGRRARPARRPDGPPAQLPSSAWLMGKSK